LNNRTCHGPRRPIHQNAAHRSIQRRTRLRLLSGQTKLLRTRLARLLHFLRD
jgi:hypothetical protein